MEKYLSKVGREFDENDLSIQTRRDPIMLDLVEQYETENNVCLGIIRKINDNYLNYINITLENNCEVINLDFDRAIIKVCRGEIPITHDTLGEEIQNILKNAIFFKDI